MPRPSTSTSACTAVTYHSRGDAAKGRRRRITQPRLVARLDASHVNGWLWPATGCQAIDADEAALASVWQHSIAGDRAAVSHIHGDLGDEGIELDSAAIGASTEQSGAQPPARDSPSVGCLAARHIPTVQRRRRRCSGFRGARRPGNAVRSAHRGEVSSLDMTARLFPQTTIAMIWDFDRTLIPEYMQEPLFGRFDVTASQFWAEVSALPAQRSTSVPSRPRSEPRLRRHDLPKSHPDLRPRRPVQRAQQPSPPRTRA